MVAIYILLLGDVQAALGDLLSRSFELFLAPGRTLLHMVSTASIHGWSLYPGAQDPKP